MEHIHTGDQKCKLFKAECQQGYAALLLSTFGAWSSGWAGLAEMGRRVVQVRGSAWATGRRWESRGQEGQDSRRVWEVRWGILGVAFNLWVGEALRDIRLMGIILESLGLLAAWLSQTGGILIHWDPATHPW